MNMEDRNPEGFLEGPIGDSGVELSYLRLELDPGVAADRWSGFLSDLQGLLEGSKQLSIPKGRGVAFNVLPEELGEGAHYLTVKMPVGTPSVAEFILQVVPNLDPPEMIRQSSKAIGGLSGFFRLLENSWPGERRASARIVASFDLSEVPPGLGLFFPRPGPGKLEGVGVGAKLDFGVQAWRFDGSELQEAHFVRSESSIYIGVKAELPIEVGPGMFRQVGSKLWEATQSLTSMKALG